MEPVTLNPKGDYPVPSATQPQVKKVPVSDEVRKTHEGFVQNIRSMIRAAVSSVLSVVKKVFHKIFGRVSVLKPAIPAPNSTSSVNTGEPSRQPSPVQEVNDDCKDDKGAQTNKLPKPGLSVQELRQQFESQGKDRENEVEPPPPAQSSVQDRESGIGSPDGVLRVTIQSKTPTLKKAVEIKEPEFGRTKSVHITEPLNYETVSLKEQSPVASRLRRKQKPWTELSEQQQNKRIVRRCIAHLDNNNADATDGIFRTPGEQTKADELKSHLLKGERIPREAEVNDVASAFKLFIMERFQIFDSESIIKIADSSDKKSDWMNLIEKLDKNEKAALKKIIRFLAKIADNSKVNRMTAENLAMTPGKAFVKPIVYPKRASTSPEEFRQMFKAETAPREAFKFLIEKHNEIF
jgi:hypothetical protein